MRPYLHELRRNALTAGVVGTVVVLGLLGVGCGYVASAPSIAGLQFVYEYDGGYHFLVYAFTFQGLPYANAPVGIWINSTLYPPSPPLASVTGRTNGVGLAALNVAIPPAGNASLTVLVGDYGDDAPLESPSAGTSQAGNLVGPLALGFWTTARTVSVLAFGATAGPPDGFQVRYSIAPDQTSPQPDLNESNMTPLGQLSGYQTNLAWSTTVSNVAGSFVVFTVFAPNGTAVESTYLPAFDLQPTGVSSAGLSAMNFLLSLPIVVSLLALFLGYARYGRERALHTMESVLWRPVTRTGLFLVRFASIALALAGGLALALGLADAWFVAALGSGFPAGVLLEIFGVFLAEGLAMAGLVVLFSHLLPSRGGVIGAAVGIFLFFSVIFSILVGVLSLHSPLGYTQFMLDLSYANPTELFELLYYAILPAGDLPSAPFAATVVVPGLALASLLWSSVPFAAGLYLARTRD